ncbi:MAG TPA: tRNA (adenosine(37)-N6)-dimethylallyltransferase MiaA [Cytophagaceae bacterium]
MNGIVGNKYLIILAGPTAVGKTSIGIELAKFFDCEIISADSRQFYKEISIGTAKPSPQELDAIKHYFIDSHTISQEYSAGMYEKDVLQLLERIFSIDDICIMVGGSGLFVQAVASGFDELPAIDLQIREDLNKQFKEEGLENLLIELKGKDPAYYDFVDISNPLRIIRALEIIRATGIPYSDLRKRNPKPRPFSIIKVGLEQERIDLYHKINLRVDQMVEAGLLTEVKSVLEYREKPALKTVGYTEIFDFLDGRYTWNETVELIKRNSRRYAKRQLTWFKKDKEFTWFSPNQIQEIKNFIRDRMEASMLK